MPTTCAKNGFKILFIERGEYPGAKNVMGGVLYRKQMEDVIPEFWKEAPLERPVIEQRFWMMDKESVVHLVIKVSNGQLNHIITLQYCAHSLTSGLQRKLSNRCIIDK